MTAFLIQLMNSNFTDLCFIPTSEYSVMYTYSINLTHKQLETHGRVLSTVATDALVLKHQGISTYTAE